MIPLLLASMLVADVNPPDIVHEPLKSATRLAELEIAADIVDDTEIFEPTVQLRRIGDAKYVPFRMETRDHLRFFALIPGGKVDADFEYYVEAFDSNGNGPARSGSPSRPHRVVVVDALPSPELVEGLVSPGPAVAPNPPAAEVKPPETEVKKPAAPAAAVQPPVAPGKPFPLGPVATLAAGVVAAGAGAALWFGAAGQVAEIDQRYAKGTGLLPEDATVVRAAQGQSILGSALALGGGALAAGGLVWLFLPAPGGGGSVGVNASF